MFPYRECQDFSFLLDIKTLVEDSDYMVGLNQKQQRNVLSVVYLKSPICESQMGVRC